MSSKPEDTERCAVSMDGTAKSEMDRVTGLPLSGFRTSYILSNKQSKLSYWQENNDLYIEGTEGARK